MKLNKYFFFIFFLLIAYLAFLVIKPYLAAILTSVLLVYIFYPVYSFLNRKIRNKNISSLITSLIIILIITVPLAFILTSLVNEATTAYDISKQALTTGTLSKLDCSDNDGFLCKTSDYLEKTISNPSIKNSLNDLIKKTSEFIVTQGSSFLLTITIKIIDLFIILFITFYLFKDGKALVYRLRKLIPLSYSHQDHILKQFNDTTFAIIHGTLIIALIQGALGAIGFWIFGLSSPILWGAIMTILALIPIIGPPVVYLPASLYMIIAGIINSNNILLSKGIGFLAFGIILISGVDTFLKPKIIGSRAKVHPVFVLLGVLGGLAAFGLIGLLFGPIILAIFVTFVNIYEKEK